MIGKIVLFVCIGLVVFLLLRFFVCKTFYKCKLLNDILKEKTADGTERYSQGRVYLLLSILSYIITLSILTGKALKPTIPIDSNTVAMILEALQWFIMLMAAYVFGNKGIEAVKLIMSAKKDNGNNQSNPPGQ